MPKKVAGPNLKKYMDHRLKVSLNAKRKVEGVLRGYDQFMNLVLDDTYEIVSESERRNIGIVVIRGNSIMQMELIKL